ncbi:hypothetical protein LXL04_021432 [Taraxacum kok-saghyz]
MVDKFRASSVVTTRAMRIEISIYEYERFWVVFGKDIGKLKVGDCSGILFWLDKWAVPKNLASVFSSIFELDKRKSCFLAERWEDRQFKAAWRRNPASQQEISELNDLQNLIRSIVGSNLGDAWKFKLANDGNFHLKHLQSADHICKPLQQKRWTERLQSELLNRQKSEQISTPLSRFGEESEVAIWRRIGARWSRSPVENRSRSPVENRSRSQIRAGRRCCVEKKEVDGWKKVAKEEGRIGQKNKQPLRKAIDSIITASTPNPTIWNPLIPIKCTTFVWRACLGRIPTAVELVKRKMNLPNTSCNSCPNGVDDVGHILMECPFVADALVWILNWCGVSAQSFSSVSDFVNFAAAWVTCPKKDKFFNAICYGFLWCAWKARNDWKFNNIQCSTVNLVDNVFLSVFGWVKNRGKFKNCKWEVWVSCPFDIICPHPNLIEGIGAENRVKRKWVTRDLIKRSSTNRRIMSKSDSHNIAFNLVSSIGSNSRAPTLFPE